jgi:hypothetical protein
MPGGTGSDVTLDALCAETHAHRDRLRGTP